MFFKSDPINSTYCVHFNWDYSLSQHWMSDWRWCLATLLFVATAELPVCFPVGDFGPIGTRNSSKMWVNWYCPSSLFMVLPLLFLISIASFIHLLYLSSSSPDINASHSSTVEKDGSLRWNVHSKWKLLDQI